MSTDVKELKIQIQSYLGSERAYWQGNSLRVTLPAGLLEKLGVSRVRSFLARDRPRFLFFETDKGLLLKVVDEETEKKLKDVIGFIDLSKLTDNDLKLIFGFAR